MDGLQLTQSLYRKRGLPKVIALKSSEYAINDQDFRDSGVDDILDSPVNPRKLILSIANLGGIDETALLEKYAKIKGQLGESPEEQSYIGSYDENGQPVESVQRVRQSIESATKVAGFPLDAKADAFRDASKIFDGASDASPPRFPLQTPPGESVQNAQQPSQKAQGQTSTPEHKKTEREQKYDLWAKKLGPLPPKHFVRDRILEFNKKVRANNVIEDIDEVEDERKTFVKALFRRR